jgi:hypothetical protein
MTTRAAASSGRISRVVFVFIGARHALVGGARNG